MNNTNQTEEQVVLIIDDEQTNLNVIIDTLKAAGLTQITARNGEMGIKRAIFSQPDLILLDVMMPGIDGFETCRRLKADPATRDIPVLFITALNDVKNKVTGFEAGGVDYITKPIEEQETLARIRTHLALRQAQRRLQHSEESLRQANDTKDTFFSIIAHDLRSPFTALLGITDVAIQKIETLSTDELRQHFLDIKRSAEAVYGLLGNLLTWSRIQRGLMDLQPVPVPFHVFMTNLLPLFALTSERKQIGVSLQIPAAIYVYADENILSTVIRNLMSNALKFTPSKGSIMISAQQQGTEVTLMIADTGVGIPKDTLPDLFRIDRKTSTEGTAGERGSGLGLPLCKDLIDQSGGRLAVESSPGQGSTFTVTLLSPHDAVHTKDDAEMSSSSQTTALSPTPLTPPPHADLHRLYEAALSGYITEIRRCIQDLGTGDALYQPFCHTITKMADEFQFEKMREFLSPYLTTSNPETIDRISLAAALARLPEDLLESLSYAVRISDIHKIQTIVEQIRRHDASLAEALTALVHDFEFAVIWDAFENLNS